MTVKIFSSGGALAFERSTVNTVLYFDTTTWSIQLFGDGYLAIYSIAQSDFQRQLPYRIMEPLRFDQIQDGAGVPMASEAAAINYIQGLINSFGANGSNIPPVVNTFADLPNPNTQPEGTLYEVENSTGYANIGGFQVPTSFTAKKEGLYYADGILGFREWKKVEGNLFASKVFYDGDLGSTTQQALDRLELNTYRAGIQSESGLVNQTIGFEPYFIQDPAPNLVNGVWSCPLPEDGEYLISLSILKSYNNGGQDFISQLLVNNNPAIMSQQQVEPKDVGGGGVVLPTVAGGVVGPTVNTGTNQRTMSNFFLLTTLTGPSVDLSLEFAGSTTNDEATIYSASLLVERFANSNV